MHKIKNNLNTEPKETMKTNRNTPKIIKDKNISFEECLLKKKILRRHPWSYGFDGGILISYYDWGSITKPSYCIPQPWK